MENHKAHVYIAVVVIQCSFAGMFILTKAAISSGMKPPVFVAYRQAFAFFALLPFALFFPRFICLLFFYEDTFMLIFVYSLFV